MMSLMAAATLPAEPDQLAGMRAEKSPLCTAASTRSATLLSSASDPDPFAWFVLDLAGLFVGMPSFLPSFLRCFLAFSRAHHRLRGTQNSILVPVPGSLSTRHHPPASCAR